jgi:hypothetical protein
LIPVSSEAWMGLSFKKAPWPSLAVNIWSKIGL